MIGAELLTVQPLAHALAEEGPVPIDPGKTLRVNVIVRNTGNVPITPVVYIYVGDELDPESGDVGRDHELWSNQAEVVVSAEGDSLPPGEQATIQADIDASLFTAGVKDVAATLSTTTDTTTQWLAERREGDVIEIKVKVAAEVVNITYEEIEKEEAVVRETDYLEVRKKPVVSEGGEAPVVVSPDKALRVNITVQNTGNVPLPYVGFYIFVADELSEDPAKWLDEYELYKGAAREDLNPNEAKTFAIDIEDLSGITGGVKDVGVELIIYYDKWYWNGTYKDDDAFEILKEVEGEVVDITYEQI